LLIVVLVVLVTAAVVFVERGQRKITVNYAKRQVGNRVYGGQTSHLPLKLNMSGVIPPIFASSIILFPATLAQWFTSGDTSNPFVRALKDVAATLSPGQPVYILLYAAAIMFFCFFYTALVFNSRDTAENLKKSGAFVPGIRPGEQTARYIDKILMRLTLAGAIYISAVCLASRAAGAQVECAVLFWRNLTADHRGGDDGFHVAGSGVRDVASV
jgi:preprotein translocase subunit SecY